MINNKIGETLLKPGSIQTPAISDFIQYSADILKNETGKKRYNN